jgi:hypothetical protein
VVAVTMKSTSVGTEKLFCTASLWIGNLYYVVALTIRRK